MMSMEKKESLNLLKIQVGSEKLDEGTFTEYEHTPRFLLLSKPGTSSFLESSLIFGFQTVFKQLYQPVQPLVFFPIEASEAARCPEVYRGIHLISFSMFGLLFDKVETGLVNDYFCQDCLNVSFESVSFNHLSNIFVSLADGDWIRSFQMNKGLLLFGVTDKCFEKDNRLETLLQIKRLEGEIRRLEMLL